MRNRRIIPVGFCSMWQLPFGRTDAISLAGKALSDNCVANWDWL